MKFTGMKIRKVEISGFRAFDKVQDATFDFSLPGGGTADFVSIYAPNGFGKTSFYDAVEWCITNQIERFHRNYSEFEKLAKENRKENVGDSYFLNHNGTEIRDGYVKVVTEINEFVRWLPTSKVYDFRSSGQNIFFKDVILSQDLIDSFIKEEKAEERYNKFIKGFPNLNSYNVKLQNIVKLCNVNGDQMKELQKRIDKTKQSQLGKDLDNDEKVLEELNKNILLVISKGYNFELIEKNSFSENDFNVLSNRLQGEVSSLAIRNQALKTRIENIDAAYNGIDNDENSKGILIYFDLRAKKQNLITRLNYFNELLQLIYSLDENKKALENNQVVREAILKIQNEFSRYLVIDNELKKANGFIDELANNNKELADTINQLNASRSNAIINSNKIELLLNTIQDKLTKIVPVKTRLEEIDTTIVLLNKFENLEHEINTSNKLLIDLEKRINDLLQLQRSFPGKIEWTLHNQDISFLQDDVKSVLDLRRNHDSLAFELTVLNDRINKQENINSELKEFINLGLQIVLKNKASSCPLCEQQYNSYLELSEKISSNRSIAEHVQILLTEKVEQEKRISTSAKIMKDEEDRILGKIKEIHENLLQLRDQLTDKIFKLLDSKTHLDQLKKEKEDLKIFFEGKSFEEFENDLLSSQAEHQKTLIDSNNFVEKINHEIVNFKFSINSNNEKVEKLNAEITTLNQNEIFRNVLVYFRDQLNSETVDLSVLNGKLTAVNKDIDRLKDDCTGLSKKIDEIKRRMAVIKVSYNDVKLEVDLLERAALLNQRTIENFEQFIRTSFEIELSKIDKAQADRQFHDLKRSVELELRDLEEVLTTLRVIESLKGQTRSYLIVRKTEQEIQELKSELRILERMDSDFREEIKKLQQFLKETINRFFYTDLINRLYQKIDPHPDYEEIKFDCDFNDSSARLQVFTKDKKGNYSVPALYFSSAQINILSLSIFLARALKAVNPSTGEPIKCIFIDDPIQSMDSINILSFIDLFRSIVMNLDRQIIISTHEENFHLLLQKKIPQNIYKSKYIEFETFGRLRREYSEI
jgi:DNA repair protein SbcC/Rad50